jgi:hypothetical protein
MQKVKFITGNGNFGGSTIALIEHCRLLNDRGYDSGIYSFEDWVVSKYDRARPMSDLKVEEDDILVYHLLEQSKKPRCKKCYLYLHEKSLWNLKVRVTTGFDNIVFVSESQREWHNRDGVVIPNPMSHLVDPALHNPPGQNVAGIVGTIQPRKLQHLSIQQALLDGRSKVLLFGDYDKDYWEGYIRPLLSDRVVYRGLYEPERRMDMYSEFDVLYIHSSDESASLALGECRLLGKEVVKDDMVADYEVASDDEVFARWEALFGSSSSRIDERYAVIPPGDEVEKLVCVVTYNRKELVSKWLRAWHNADKCGAKIAVLHSFDGDSPPRDEMANILAGRPDYYIPFKNTDLRDMQALVLVIRDMARLPQWKYLFWFTDDCMPMRKEFLRPFDEKIRIPNVGLVAQCYEPRPKEYGGDAILPHIRTIGYALRREAADRLSFPTVGFEKERPYLFEHGRKGFYEDHILNQVLKAGFKFRIAHSNTEVTREVDSSSEYVHWTDVLDWMWDCHLFKDGTDFGRRLTGEDYWDIYERQFVPDEDRDEYTLFSPKRCEELSLIPRKICAVIPTFSCPMNCFMWSIFSLFLRSDPRELEHVIIGINGPDSRDPNPAGCPLQDRKQCFVEDLRNVRDWNHPNMFNPGAITLIRTWSRIGHAQMLEQCINWVHTEFYLSMHDDVIVMDRGWSKAVDEFKDKNLVVKSCSGGTGLGAVLLRKMQRVNDTFELPHFNSIFTLCNKPRMKMINANWVGHHIRKSFRIGDFLDYHKFMELHRKLGSLECDHPSLSIKGDDHYDSCSMDIGTFVFSQISRSGMRVSEFPDSSIKHFEAVTWRNQEAAYKMHPEVEELESEIRAVPQYWELYEKYREPLSREQNSDAKP